MIGSLHDLLVVYCIWGHAGFILTIGHKLSNAGEVPLNTTGDEVWASAGYNASVSN